MNVEAIDCRRCGGPLANPTALPALVDCVYCGTVHSLGDGAPGPSDVNAAIATRKDAIQAFTLALVAAIEGGASSYDALRQASSAHLGIAGRPDTVARIAIALARDFEVEARVPAVTDPLILSRITQAYLLALDELRERDNYDLNLPFLAVNSAGPVHLRRQLTAPLLVELARRDPGTGSKATTVAAGDTAEPPPKRRGWWPFS